MEPALESLHETAFRISKRATTFFLAAKRCMTSEDCISPIIGLALNRIAIDEFKRALNTMNFIERYEVPDG